MGNAAFVESSGIALVEWRVAHVATVLIGERGLLIKPLFAFHKTPVPVSSHLLLVSNLFVRRIHMLASFTIAVLMRPFEDHATQVAIFLFVVDADDSEAVSDARRMATSLLLLHLDDIGLGDDDRLLLSIA